MLLRQSQTAPSSDSNDAISNKERDTFGSPSVEHAVYARGAARFEYSALWVTLEKLISPPKSNRKKKLVSSAFGSLQHHLHEKHQRWYKHLAAKILHHNRNLDAPYRRYETRSLVNLALGVRIWKVETPHRLRSVGSPLVARRQAMRVWDFSVRTHPCKHTVAVRAVWTRSSEEAAAFPPPNVDTQARISRGRLFVWISR